MVGSILLGACASIPLVGGGARSAPAGQFDVAEEMAPMMAPEFEMEGIAADSAAAGEPMSQIALESFQDRLVIRNANMSIVVEDPAESVDRISQLATSMGGFVVSSNVFQTTFGESQLREPIIARQASITIRVPSERLDEALDRIKADALDVLNQNVSGQDVTEEFTDIQSRLRNLEAAEEQLLEILDGAVETEDVLRVFEELRRVREEIEVLRGRAQYLQESARMSAISVELVPDEANQPIQIGRWTPTGTAREAVEALIQALQFLADVAIWGVICVLPVGLIVGLPGYLAMRAILRRRRASAKPEPAPGKAEQS
jgi:hypothetical protein